MARSLQPESALNSWRQWSARLNTRPVVLGPLSGGRSNRSFLLDSDGSRMVLRLNGTDSLLPGANRSNETGIWQAASKQGIAPPLLHVDKDAGYLVSAYIDNSLPSQPPFDKNFVKRAFALLRHCHQLEVEAADIDYVKHIEQYWQIIDRKDHPLNPTLIQQREPMQSLLETLLNSGTPTALCHHDPVTANFVGSPDRLYLIDWEYAAHGLLVMDYAALGIEWEIDDSLIIEQTGIEADLLTMAKSLYKYLCKLWSAS